MFYVILSVCEKNNLFQEALYLKVDFEKALINAVKNVLGEHLTINECFYHRIDTIRKDTLNENKIATDWRPSS